MEIILPGPYAQLFSSLIGWQVLLIIRLITTYTSPSACDTSEVCGQKLYSIYDNRTLLVLGIYLMNLNLVIITTCSIRDLPMARAGCKEYTRTEHERRFETPIKDSQVFTIAQMVIGLSLPLHCFIHPRN